MKAIDKLRTWIQTWIDGGKVKGIKVSLLDVQELIIIYNEMVKKEKPEFINSNVKKVLDKCQISTEICGIGWKVV